MAKFVYWQIALGKLRLTLLQTQATFGTSQVWNIHACKKEYLYIGTQNKKTQKLLDEDNNKYIMHTTAFEINFAVVKSYHFFFFLLKDIINFK